MIDLSQMRGVRVDPERRRARVEGGATWRDVDRETQAFGLAAPGGLISNTGVAGLTLSGGIGWLRSRHGLCIDNLVSAEVVTADGRLLRAQRGRKRRPAVGAQRRRRQLRSRHGVRVRVASGRADADVLRAALPARARVPGRSASGATSLPTRATTSARIVEFSTIPSDPDYPEQYWGERIYTIAAVYAGDAGEGERLLQPLRELGDQVADFSGQMSYCEIQQLFDALMPVRPVPGLLEEPLSERSRRCRHRPDPRRQCEPAVAQHAVLDLELRRRDSPRCGGRLGLRRSIDAVHAVHRLGLGGARR